MENYKTTSAQISASSPYSIYHAPNQGRLNFKHSGSYRGGWSAGANDLNQWFQVDLGIDISVTSVATQGKNLYESMGDQLQVALWKRWKLIPRVQGKRRELR